MTLRRVATLAGLALGVAALMLQASLSFPARLAQGRDLIDAILWFFTYFTILTNIMLVLVYLSELVDWSWLGWWRSAVTRGMMAGAIALVMGFYHFVLAATWSPQGWALVGDVSLHYATPILYLGWWLVCQAKGALRLADIPLMLAPPLAWLAWAMVRGAIVTEYPYPVLETHVLGYPQVLLNIVFLLAVLVLIFAIVVGIDRWLGRRAAAHGRATP
jgi:hypothetical protein